MGRLEGKVAFVTGAARGQGRSHALRLAEEGADIIAVDLCEQIASVPYAMSTPGDLEETAKQVEQLDRRIVARQADVRDGDAVAAALAAGESEVGPVDVLVANAGIFSTEASETMARQTWQDMIDTNLTGVWNACQAVLPGMKERNGGSMILTSSTAGIKGFPTLAHYTAAKHGVVGVMKALAAEFGQYNIRVNTVHPTSVDTDMIQNSAMYNLFRPDIDNPGRNDFGELFQSMHELPVMWTEPRDISNAVLFLASDESRYITAQQLKVDLGYCEK
ncbi:mycofactocin-coupled SDR family oxidoreductase [Pseudonocardia endophytica]|uniref:(+)-trans-carveol dehydrogenase n=1 Tax=Pseudonocardia endophytica TaxID=401976 RepID=A0A4R1HJK3_PSEEN|nr:mycofactocin-coupled SDR family oxidoreductase [Pseudonocardia endophytica]TCK22038.1 (+)-trans-carveol dehydrogenase [Pseudonocardia endophytica]